MIINGGVLNGGVFRDQNNGFTISSADFTNWNWGSYLNINANLGFETTNDTVGPGYAFYSPQLGSSSGGSDAKLAEVKAYFDANGLNHNNRAYMFNATFGAGSTQAAGVVILELYYWSATQGQLNMGIVDTSNPAWQVDYSNYYSGPPYTLLGTWNFPMTFSLITPPITDNSNWC